MARRKCVLLVLAGSIPFILGCPGTRTPTEVPAFVAPTPAPTPAVVVGQPASLSGFVRSYGPLEPGTTVECQGKSTTTAADESFSLSGLLSGSTLVTVRYSFRTSDGTIADSDENVTVVLQPGANTVDLLVL